ncbi:hypothetical protein [Comamonas testosteroni]|uniref:hypothetical protein n=1 Tax=Comamonas testosteroni TaxID=285 RepID=UPI0005B4102A|nr:hypothetical protein [Comamonas testosteroni]
MTMNREKIKANRLVLDEVEEVMALVRDFDLKGWLAAEAKLDNNESLEGKEADAASAEEALRNKLHELCSAAARQRNAAQLIPLAWIHNDTLETMKATDKKVGERWPVVRLSEWDDKSAHTALCIASTN